MEVYSMAVRLSLALVVILMASLSCSKKEPFKITVSEFKAGNMTFMPENCPQNTNLSLTLKTVDLGGGMSTFELNRIDGSSVYGISNAQMISLDWCPGVEHSLLGNMNILGYKFESDSYTPLVFKVVKDIGYVYQRGKGAVTSPKGEKIQFGAQ